MIKQLGLALTLLLSACADGDQGLSEIHADIMSDLPSVTHISSAQLAELDNVLVLDIREPQEFAVSRLPGAIWISPEADAQNTLILTGDVTDKHIIVYCSVGWRSSLFAQRTQDELLKMGASSVANLENGIFGWHNDQNPLINASEKTDAVHPYNAVWKRYVRRKDKARYEPVTAK